MFESILIGTPKHQPFKRLLKLLKGYRETLESSQELTCLVLAQTLRSMLGRKGGWSRDTIDGFLVLHAHARETSV
jgi:hypothetical protein